MSRVAGGMIQVQESADVAIELILEDGQQRLGLEQLDGARWRLCPIGA
ncbi:MAG: hypothetical protein ACREJC_18125 [Tepidisphaeraceae bacterium]